MLDTLKQDLLTAIFYLKDQKMRFLNKGSISVFDRANNLIVAEPAPEHPVINETDLLVVDLSGQIVEGNGTTIVDLPAHIELYKAFPNISSIVHSHGIYTTAWAQAGRDIPVYGTSHIDFFTDAIPCTDAITTAEAESGYETASGVYIADIFEKKAYSPDRVCAALLFQHGAYAWGNSAMNAANCAVALEQIAMLAYLTEKINPEITGLARNIVYPGKTE